MPVWTTTLAIVGVCALVLPLAGMGHQAPWSRLPQLITSDEALSALLLSLRTCIAATICDVVLGVPLALLLARDWPGVQTTRVVVLLPLSLPPVVAGLALLATFGRRGLLGPSLQVLGITIAFSTTAVVMAQVFVSLPFLVTTLEAALRARPSGLEETAAGLGARPTRVLGTITLPTIVPELTRGTALAMARCLGEFGATITFAGSLQGVTRTMPLEIYLARETDTDTALALGMVLVAVGAVVVALTQWQPSRRRRDRRPRTGRQWTSDDLPPVTHLPAQASSVDVKGRVLARNWSVDFSIDAGQVVAVMGRNGAGKSTLAAVISGMLSLDEGQVRIGDRLVDGRSGNDSGRRVLVGPRRRNVALLAQHPRIFGHMSVLANVAYGPRCHRVPRARARAIALAELDAVGCLDLASRRGDQLSGGQAARVALARALAVRPAVLILDEPTAALDVEATAAVHRVLRSRLAETGTTAILITHDVVDAVSVASRLVVLEGGAVAEQGPPRSLLSKPESPFTARLAGLNLIRDATGTTVVPPEGVTLRRTEPGATQGLPGVIAGAEESAAQVVVLVALDSGQTIRSRTTLARWTGLGLDLGDPVRCQVDPAAVRALPEPGRP
ncbi:MAG: molybdate ABC transporter permease subunit [Acidipropionibacterium sp.]|nr:molybdate ABC transporter permease subunit [Acidipropionibacterium sp.]